ncbi:MAG: ribonuclease HII [Roseiflexaceae bacterium]|nr:ribonuclease HII [Roseiflexus sp.]MDW8214739.1 ribonuclease HII [Roseiflexaceae bacterium]
MTGCRPTVEEERALRAAGYRAIAGVDEAGRGCWAGPVVAAAVILPEMVIDTPALLDGVADSKTLTPAQRATLFERITSLAVAWAVGATPAHIVDSHGILPATRLAMQVALLRLPRPADALLIDAVQLGGWPLPQRVLIKGDARCLSIAAASIIAKVTRDRFMEALGQRWPEYGFAAHKGYGTAAHQRALRRYGPTPQHRLTFRPLYEMALADAERTALPQEAEGEDP